MRYKFEAVIKKAVYGRVVKYGWAMTEEAVEGYAIG